MLAFALTVMVTVSVKETASDSYSLYNYICGP